MTSTATTRNETVLRAAIEHWNAGDLEGYLGLYDEGVRLHGYTPEPMDKAAVRAIYEQIFAAFPDSRITIHETLIDGDRISARFTLTGRHRARSWACRVPAPTSRYPVSRSCTSGTALRRALVERGCAGPARSGRSGLASRLTPAGMAVPIVPPTQVPPTTSEAARGGHRAEGVS
jgi:hypothetical protein